MRAAWHLLVLLIHVSAKWWNSEWASRSYSPGTSARVKQPSSLWNTFCVPLTPRLPCLCSLFRLIKHQLNYRLGPQLKPRSRSEHWPPTPRGDTSSQRTHYPSYLTLSLICRLIYASLSRTALLYPNRGACLDFQAAGDMAGLGSISASAHL